jgi:hypothetical protein
MKHASDAFCVFCLCVSIYLSCLREKQRTLVALSAVSLLPRPWSGRLMEPVRKRPSAGLRRVRRSSHRSGTQEKGNERKATCVCVGWRGGDWRREPDRPRHLAPPARGLFPRVGVRELARGQAALPFPRVAFGWWAGLELESILARVFRRSSWGWNWNWNWNGWLQLLVCRARRPAPAASIGHFRRV